MNLPVGFFDGDGVGSLVGGAALIGRNGSPGELNEEMMNGR